MRDVAKRNQRMYDGILTVRAYERSTELQIPEAVIFERLRPELEGKRILDIGVGGGRTTRYLLELSSDYTGIDYSSRMIARCKIRYPSVPFSVCDARDLSSLGSRAFDFVLFSFNGIDHLGQTDRLKALSEIRSVLAPDGVFVFSSHNHRSQFRSPWSLQHLPFGINPLVQPLQFFRKLAMYPIGIARHAINRSFERIEQQYSILNSEAHNYGLVHYYIKPQWQVRQLIGVGFREIRAVGLDGRWLSEKDYPKDHKDAWIYYVCRS